MGNLSHLALEDGEFATAALLSEQAAARAREHGFELIEAMATCNQAVALIHEDDPRAGATALSALRLCARTNLHLWIGNCLFVVAAAIATKEPRRAAVLLGASDAELQSARTAPAETEVYENATIAVRAALGATAFEESIEEAAYSAVTQRWSSRLGRATGQATSALPLVAITGSTKACALGDCQGCETTDPRQPSRCCGWAISGFGAGSGVERRWRSSSQTASKKGQTCGSSGSASSARFDLGVGRR
jgi:hypothetical protein